MESRDKIKEYIRKTGLTENEAKVYMALLEFGPNPAGAISRKSGLHRRVIYDTTEMLIKKGMIGYIQKNNRKLFQASNPNRILEMLKEKEESIQEILPHMLNFYNKTQEKDETNFYKGKNGLKTVFEDQIQTGKEILILGASSIAYEMLQFYFHWFDKRRTENKIKTKIIFNKGKNIKMKKIPLSEIRYLSEKYSSPLAVNIYGDKVAIILWSKENPFAIVIKQKEIADGYKKYFELLWTIAKK
jgi:sugar-specific transcriptional regulator TrmB